MGVVAELIGGTVWIFLAMTLYLLLKDVNKTAARATMVLAALGTGVMLLNAVFEFESLRAATGAVDLSALGTAGSNSVVMLLLDTQHSPAPSRRSGWSDTCSWSA